MDNIAVVSEDAGKLLGDVGATISTACACSWRFFRVPIESCWCHYGWWGLFESWVRMPRTPLSWLVIRWPPLESDGYRLTLTVDCGGSKLPEHNSVTRGSVRRAGVRFPGIVSSGVVRCE